MCCWPFLVFYRGLGLLFWPFWTLNMTCLSTLPYMTHLDVIVGHAQIYSLEILDSGDQKMMKMLNFYLFSTSQCSCFGLLHGSKTIFWTLLILIITYLPAFPYHNPSWSDWGSWNIFSWVILDLGILGAKIWKNVAFWPHLKQNEEKHFANFFF